MVVFAVRKLFGQTRVAGNDSDHSGLSWNGDSDDLIPNKKTPLEDGSENAVSTIGNAN
jgi:hypothetical protein